MYYVMYKNFEKDFKNKYFFRKIKLNLLRTLIYKYIMDGNTQYGVQEQL